MQRKTQEEVWKEYVLRTLRQFRKILTTQGSHIGEVISTDGTNLIWTTVSGGSSLPNQSGNNGKYLTTNGSTASWANITIPSGIVTTSDVGTVTNTMLAVNAITINGISRALGSTFNTTLSTDVTINLATFAIDLTRDIFNITLNINTTITLSSSRVGVFVFKITQGTGGSKVITWPASVKWPGNIPPVLSTTAGKIDIITLVFDGSNYYGTYALNY